MTCKNLIRLALALMCNVFASLEASAQLFSIDIETPGHSPYFESFNNAENSIDAMNAVNLRSHFLGINEDTAAVNARLNYRGLPMEFDFVANSSIVRFRVPSLGINETFNSFSRDASLDLLVDFLEKDGGQLTNDISRTLAQTTSTDPIAGNPGSLMSTQVTATFASDFFAPSPSPGSEDSSVENPEAVSSAADNKWMLGVNLSDSTASNNDVQTITLPLSYTINFDEKPLHSLRISFPLSSTTINGQAKSYTLGAGVAYSFPVSESVRLTPGINYGAVGSVDLASAAAARSIFLTTIYDFSWAGQNWRFGNTVSSSKTESIELDDVVIDPGISNQVMVNGIIWKGLPVSWGHVELFFTDTRFFGDALYSEQHNDLGINISNIGQSGYKFKVGLTYQWADRSDIKGWMLNTSSSF